MADGELATRFGQVVARMDAAMVVVTTVVDGEPSGCLVGFHSQCSIDPPRYAVWISKVNHTFGLIDGARYVAVHVLQKADQPLARLFGGETGDAVDKFTRWPWSEGVEGVPLLDGVTTRFVGRKVAVTDEGGDHVCVVLEPVDALVGTRGVMLTLSDEAGLHPGHPA